MGHPVDRFSAIKGPKKSGRYVQVTAIQRWPLSRFDCSSTVKLTNSDFFVQLISQPRR